MIYLLLSLTAVLIFCIIIICKIVKENPEILNFTLCLSLFSITLFLSLLSLTLAIDVYHEKTKLEITETIKDSTVVSRDSIVVFK